MHRQIEKSLFEGIIDGDEAGEAVTCVYEGFETIVHPNKLNRPITEEGDAESQQFVAPQPSRQALEEVKRTHGF
jgi:hypothetical protein